MAVKKKENQAEAQNAQDEKAPAKSFPAELREAIWSVVSFDKCEASNLTYAEAEQKLGELQMQKVASPVRANLPTKKKPPRGSPLKISRSP